MNNQTFKISAKRGILEFLLIVLGVTIALWLENISEEYKERSIEQEYLISFQNDVRKDIIRLKTTIKNNQTIVSNVKIFLDKLMSKKIGNQEFIENITSLMNYDYFSPDDFTLESIRASGDFRLLKDKKIKRKILQLKRSYEFIEELQNNFQGALDDQIVPMIIENVNLTNGTLVNADFPSDHRLANITGYTINDVQGRVGWYKASLKTAESLYKLLQEKTGIKES